MTPLCIIVVIAILGGYSLSLYAEYRHTKNTFKETEEREKVNVEAAMPYDAVLEDLCRYDASKPKMDELLLIREMQKKYGQDKQAVIRRIREVRRTEIKKKERN